MSAARLSTARAHADDHSGPGVGIYLAFIPWVLFTLIAQHSTLKAAAVVALVGSLAIAGRSIAAGRPKVLELGAVVAFVGFTVVAFTAHGSTGADVARYARAIAAALLALIALSSLLFTPFTEHYARESVPREFWSSPRFKQVNRQLTLMWALVFCLMVPSHVIAGAINTRPANLIFNWAIPIILIMWAAKRTGAVSGAESQEGRVR